MFAELRKEAGLSQAELAEQSGLSRSTISRLESGKQLPSVDTIIKLTGPLNCTADRLFMEVWENGPS